MKLYSVGQPLITAETKVDLLHFLVSEFPSLGHVIVSSF